MDFGKPRYFERNLLFFTDDLPRVRFHSIENLILNLTQAIRDSTQVVERIAAGSTPWTSENQGISLFFTENLPRVRCHSIQN